MCFLIFYLIHQFFTNKSYQTISRYMKFVSNLYYIIYLFIYSYAALSLHILWTNAFKSVLCIVCGVWCIFMRHESTNSILKIILIFRILIPLTNAFNHWFTTMTRWYIIDKTNVLSGWKLNKYLKYNICVKVIIKWALVKRTVYIDKFLYLFINA